MTALDELKKISENLENSDKLKKQLDLLSILPGEYNQQVFEKLLELAKHDPQVINVFINQFILTSKKLLNK